MKQIIYALALIGPMELFAIGLFVIFIAVIAQLWLTIL